MRAMPGFFGCAVATDVQSLFDTNNKVDFQFVNESKIDGHRVLTFQYRVGHQDPPLWRLHMQNQVVAPPYHGQLLIDGDTHALVRLQVVALELPRSFPMRRADLQIDYVDVGFGDGTSFVRPLESVVNTALRDGSHTRNVLQFATATSSEQRRVSLLSSHSQLSTIDRPRSAGCDDFGYRVLATARR
jgi:hypothetical protein